MLHSVERKKKKTYQDTSHHTQPQPSGANLPTLLCLRRNELDYICTLDDNVSGDDDKYISTITCRPIYYEM